MSSIDATASRSVSGRITGVMPARRMAWTYGSGTAKQPTCQLVTRAGGRRYAGTATSGWVTRYRVPDGAGISATARLARKLDRSSGSTRVAATARLARKLDRSSGSTRVAATASSGAVRPWPADAGRADRPHQSAGWPARATAAAMWERWVRAWG